MTFAEHSVVEIDDEMRRQMYGGDLDLIPGLDYSSSEIVEIELTMRYSERSYVRANQIVPNRVNWVKEGF